jgi:4-hydroxy-tetrahydrodipicolinate synthase
MSQSEFVYYLEQLVPQLPLPFLMYNMPSCTKLHMSLPTVRRAMELGAIGIKDSSGNLPYLLSLIEEFKDSPEFAIIAGSEMFIPETVLHGGHGAVPGGANIYPSLFVELYEASVNADSEKIEMLKAKMVAIEEKIYNVGSYTSKYVKTIKSALGALGICNDFVAMPFRKFDEVKNNRIKQNLKEMNILEAVHSNTIKT